MKFSLFGGNTPKLEWQKLKSKHKNVPDLYRSAVHGGWLIGSDKEAFSLVFLPDPDHQWDGASIEQDEDNN